MAEADDETQQAPAGAEVTSVVATHFDTADGALRRHGTTLRRVVGGPEEGWHLRLAVAGTHAGEVSVPLSAGRRLPPRSVRELVLGLTLGAPLEGSSVELVGDATALDGVQDVQDGDPHGSDGSDGSDGGAATSGPRLRKVKPGKPAARLLHAYLVQQHTAMLTADLAVRRREPEGLHDLRVTLRRLRSALSTYRPLVDRAVTDPLRAQMREVSHLLGDGRDAEVVGERLQRLLDDEPADLRLGAARRTIGDERRAALRLARRTIEDTLNSPEYVAMLRGVGEVAAAPPWTAGAEAPARLVAPRRIAKEVRRLRSRRADVAEATSAAERARLLHEVRKAAKRVRYACEVAGPALGRDAARLQEAAEDVQDVLGEHHDTMSTRSALRRLAGRAELHPGTAFTLGRLHAREEHRSRRPRARGRHRLGRARPPSGHRVALGASVGDGRDPGSRSRSRSV